MNSLMMSLVSICILFLLTRGSFVASDNKITTNWTFLPLLKEICPYASFCELNATAKFPPGDERRPCCDSCSCRPDCREYGHCCFEDSSQGEPEIVSKCTSPVVSNSKNQAPRYMMIYSCSNFSNVSTCAVNDNEMGYNSFGPVTSVATGAIYVNSECAECNDVHDFIPWQIAIKCDDFDYLNLLGEDMKDTGCHVVYTPPENINTESRECVEGAIRECNVTGNMEEWTPFWNYCPLFNATFSRGYNKFYSNIFCFLCNKQVDNIADLETCKAAGNKIPGIQKFTALLTGIAAGDLALERQSSNECSTVDSSALNGNTQCRQYLCPIGKLRINNKCGFYSEEWLGESFTAVLRLTPLDRERVERSLVSVIQQEGSGLKATWLNRHAMKDWNINTLYRLSKDGDYVDYFVVFATYRKETVDPSQLEDTLRRTLDEVWEIQVRGRNIPLRIEFNIHEHFKKMDKLIFEEEGIFLNINYGFIVLSYHIEDNHDKYMLPLYFPGPEFNHDNTVFLNELFICERIVLSPDEFKVKGSVIWLTETNETIHEAQFKFIKSGVVSICVDRIIKNKSSNLAYEKLVATLPIFLIFTNMLVRMI